MKPLAYPTPDDLHVWDYDTVIAEHDDRGYSCTMVYYATDEHGDDWRWFEYHTYSFEEGEWLPVEVSGMERVE